MKIRASVIGGIIWNETKGMTPVPTQKLFDDLYVVKDLFANVFLVKDGDDYVAIDAGISAANISTELASLNVDARNVKAVLVTHSDIDHVNGIAAFADSEVYLPEAEVPMLNNFRITMTEREMSDAAETYKDFEQSGELNLFAGLEYWPDDDIEFEEGENGGRISFLKNRLDRSYKTVGDGETLKIGNINVETVLIDGHTKGLTAYLVNKKYLFVGDGVSLRAGQIRPFNSFLNLNETVHRESIEKIRKLKGFKYLFTQHYGFTGDVEKSFAG